jgi:GH43 family beta-xylosidase
MRQRRSTIGLLILSLLMLSISVTGIIGQTEEPTAEPTADPTAEAAETEEAMPEATLEPGTLRNPLNAAAGADPWLVYYEGNYYFSATTGSSSLVMRKSPTLAGLKMAGSQVIYTETEPSRCCNMWAPEFFMLDGPDGPRWYYYYSAGTSDTLDNQRTHVLESAGTDPMGPYTYKGKVADPTNDVWAIDGSLLQLNDELYFLFSSWTGDYQIIYIAPMSDPWTISGSRVELTRSEYDWEKHGPYVNEGPEALYHDDDTFIIYSASFCATPDYALGMLTYNGGDPMDKASWEKSAEPVFQRSDANGVFGPGHNGFFKSPDGTEDWIVYHANDAESDVCDQGRTTRVQKIEWNEDGTPNFGEPLSLDTVIDAPSGDEGIDVYETVSFASVGMEGTLLRHVSGEGARLDYSITPVEDAQFIAHPGLADPTAMSFESVNFPGFYLSHESNIIRLSPNRGTPESQANITWWLREGLSDPEAISFEAYSEPGKFIGRRLGILALVAETDMTNDQMRAESTFLKEIGN